MPRTLLEQVVKEATAQVFIRGLVRKVETLHGIGYEITDAGWQFIRERAWPGGVKIMQLDTSKIKRLGWKAKRASGG